MLKIEKCWKTKNVEIRKMLKFEKCWNLKNVEKQKNVENKILKFEKMLKNKMLKIIQIRKC